MLYRSLTFLSSSYGPEWGFWVLGWCPWVNILPVHNQTCPRAGIRLTIPRSSHQSTFVRGFLHYMAYETLTRCWIILFSFLKVIKIISGLYNPNAQSHLTRSCRNCFSHRPDWPQNMSIMGPRTMDFVLRETSRGLVQILNSHVFIEWTWLKFVGLGMVSVNENDARSYPNTSLSKHRIDLSEELMPLNICSWFSPLGSVAGSV